MMKLNNWLTQAQFWFTVPQENQAQLLKLMLSLKEISPCRREPQDKWF